jgi:hypothetical protein
MMLVHSCSVSKRQYRRGFHVEWSGGHSGDTKQIVRNQAKAEPVRREVISEAAPAELIANADVQPLVVPGQQMQQRQMLQIPVEGANNAVMAITVHPRANSCNCSRESVYDSKGLCLIAILLAIALVISLAVSAYVLMLLIGLGGAGSIGLFIGIGVVFLIAAVGGVAGLMKLCK